MGRPDGMETPLPDSPTRSHVGPDLVMVIADVGAEASCSPTGRTACGRVGLHSGLCDDTRLLLSVLERGA